MCILLVKWTKRGRVIPFGPFRSTPSARAFFKSEMIYNHHNVEPSLAAIYVPNDCPRRRKMAVACRRIDGRWIDA